MTNKIEGDSSARLLSEIDGRYERPEYSPRCRKDAAQDAYAEKNTGRASGGDGTSEKFKRGFEISGISADEYERKYRLAKRTALNILAYRDNTEISLRRKLRERGYSAELTDEVICEMKALGYLDEERMIITAVLYMAQVKLYGKRRIFAELRAKGYSRQSISELDFSKGELAEIDFEENRRKLIEKKGGELTPKVRAFLTRYGY